MKTLVQHIGSRRFSPSAPDQTGTWPQDLSVSALWKGDRAEPSVAMDIACFFPTARGFVYLAVVLDWFSRLVLSRRLSITMEVGRARMASVPTSKLRCLRR